MDEIQSEFLKLNEKLNFQINSNFHLISSLIDDSDKSLKLDEYRYRDDIYIIHSMPKTATTSVGDAIIKLGLSELDHQWHPELYKKNSDIIEYCNLIIGKYDDFSDIAESDKKLVIRLYLKIIDSIKEYNLFTDYPIGHIKIDPFVKKILFPKCKMIWCERNVDSWLESVKKWELLHFDIYPNAKERWNEKNICYTKEKLVAKYLYNKHRLSSLKKNFPNDILFRDIESEWDELCSFLNVDIPNFDFPNVNVNRSNINEK